MMIGEAVLRSNPRYELVLLDRLGQEERDLLAEEDGDRASPYGVLRATEGSGLVARAVSADTALLFLTLQQPGRCPEYVRRGLGDRLASTLGGLVMDDILEVESEDGFRSGWAGWAPLVGVRQTGNGGRTGELSKEALRHGQALLKLADVPAELVAARLYMYGRQPLTPRSCRRMPSEEAVAHYLGLDSVAVRPVLRLAWRESSQRDGSPWRNWNPRRAMAGRRRVTFKLYVSPATDSLPAAFAAVVAGLADARGVVGFKVARSVEGLARPDKLVAYFDSLDALHEGAGRIAERAGGCQPHGVPFTAAVTQDGMLSWAIDPPSTRGSRPSGRASWRSWVTGRLADHLVSARSGATDSVEPYDIALARLALDGVDPATWIPDPEIFDYAAAG